ncbi:HPr kinase/phosphatase C-terminal domain-containing protein [Ponticoccus gilvus]|nr:HPr kinase/phosphatase C-terminal domain-containing protein [Enemella evansiae]
MPEVLHASAVALRGRGLLICGASGSGKSGLALELMARGASLIADDRVIATRQGDTVRLTAPEAIRGMIEARGIGLLNATPAGDTALAAILDLDTPEPERLPPFRTRRLLGLEFPLLHNPASPYLSSALVQYLCEGRRM